MSEIATYSDTKPEAFEACYLSMQLESFQVIGMAHPLGIPMSILTSTRPTVPACGSES